MKYWLLKSDPEEFTWQDFMNRVNNELLANWGNLVNRVLGFAYKRFDGVIPTPGALAPGDEALLADAGLFGRDGLDGAGHAARAGRGRRA